MTFIRPRRFAECWQVSSDYPGTLDQQQAVRDAFALEHGTDKHRVFQALDRSLNQIYRRSFAVFGFLPDDMWPPNLLAIAGVTGINMRAGIVPEVVGDLALHELGHVLDKHLLTAATRLEYMTLSGIDPELNTWNRNVQETFADSARDWLKGNGDGRLCGLLLEEV